MLQFGCDNFTNRDTWLDVLRESNSNERSGLVRYVADVSDDSGAPIFLELRNFPENKIQIYPTKVLFNAASFGDAIAIHYELGSLRPLGKLELKNASIEEFRKVVDGFKYWQGPLMATNYRRAQSRWYTSASMATVLGFFAISAEVGRVPGQGDECEREGKALQVRQ